MFLGWYNPDKKITAAVKLGDAIARYREKFDAEPAVVIVNPAEATELSNAMWHGADLPDLEVRSASYIPHHTFYVGYDDAPEPEPSL